MTDSERGRIPQPSAAWPSGITAEIAATTGDTLVRTHEAPLSFVIQVFGIEPAGAVPRLELDSASAQGGSSGG